MTTPSGYFPPSAFNYGTGLAAFAAATIDDYKAQINDGWNPTLTVLEQGLTTVVDDIKTLIEDIAKLIDGILGTGHTIEEVADFLLTLGTDFAALLSNLLHGGVAINVANLFGTIASELLPQVGVGSIGATMPNLVINPGFNGAISMDVGAGTWSWDETTDHTGTAGSGSAKVVADGGVKQLLSNAIAVSEDQQMSFAVWIKWQSLVFTGSPIKLDVATYLNGTLVTTVNAVAKTPTSGTGGWERIVGYYTIPAGVDAIRVRLAVTTASSGTVWFDDVEARKTGLLGQSLIDGLEAALDGFVSLITHNALVDAIAGEIGADLAAVTARVNGFLTALSTLDATKLVGEVTDALIITPLVNLMNAIGQAITGLTQTFGPDAILENLAAMAQSIIGLQTQVAQLQTIYTSGVSDGDEFERTSSSNLGAGWLQYYSSGGGTWATPNGHDASWIKSGTSTRDVLCLRNAGQVRSTTNLQRVVVVLATVPEFDSLLDVCGHVDVWLRVSDDTSSLSNVTGIRCRLSGDGSVSIDRFVAGTRTLLNRVTGPVGMAAGTSFVGEAGKPGVARYFACRVNGVLVNEIAEVGTTSGLGPTFLRWGHGARAEGHLLSQMAPGSIRQWTVSDQ